MIGLHEYLLKARRALPRLPTMPSLFGTMPPPTTPTAHPEGPGSRGGHGHVRTIERGPRAGQMAFMYGDDPEGHTPAAPEPPVAPVVRTTTAPPPPRAPVARAPVVPAQQGGLFGAEAQLLAQHEPAPAPPPQEPLTGTAQPLPVEAPAEDERPVLTMEQTGARAWNVLEPNYIAWRHELQLKRNATQARLWGEQAAQLKRGTKKWEEAEAMTQVWQRRVAAAEEKPRYAEKEAYSKEYRDKVKEAISKGMPVPAAVVGQYAEFQHKADARARYDKGRHTSFANVSAAVDRSMEGERGYKIKRQDGKPMLASQRDEIASGMNDIEAVLGNLAPLMAQGHLTIAHTSGKHPFLKKYAGLYHPGDKTITVGWDSPLHKHFPALAHEMAHWIDNEAGDRTGIDVPLFNKEGKRIGKAGFVSEHDRRRYDASSTSERMYQYAVRNMTDTREVARLLRADPKDATTTEQRDKIERAKVFLGPYYRDPREVFARLTEQYIASRLARGGVATQTPTEYKTEPGYWSDAHFAVLTAMIRDELRRRLEMLNVPTDTLMEAEGADATIPPPLTAAPQQQTIAPPRARAAMSERQRQTHVADLLVMSHSENPMVARLVIEDEDTPPWALLDVENVWRPKEGAEAQEIADDARSRYTRLITAFARGD